MAGSTTRRGGRQKGTPNKATVARQQAMEAGRLALERLASGDNATLADIQASVDNDTHSNLVDQAAGTMTEAQALVSVAVRENKTYNTALEYLQDTYRDNRLPRGLRQDAAKAAIRYETPALSNVAVQAEVDVNADYKDADTRMQLEDMVGRALLRAGIVPQRVVHDVIEVEDDADSEDV